MPTDDDTEALALEQIRLANQARIGADELLRSAVRAARDLGISWARIGTTLGVTRAAVQKRFGGTR